jgi:protein involved in polysaccharide export with SLBB domain
MWCDKRNIIWAYLILAVLAANQPAFSQNFSELESQPKGDVITQPAGEGEEESIQNVINMAKQMKFTPAQDDAYLLDKTDVIDVSVMRHPEVSGKYAINTEGKIQYEFVGDIVVGGLTKNEVSKIISEKLKDYIINPEVTVKIAEYNSKMVYVVGEVYKPGKIFMRGNTITVREALLEAGLPMLSGITKKSKLITPSEMGKGDKKDVNVYALLYEGDLRENLVMQPGDILYIPPTFLTKTMRAISPITAPVADAAGTGRTVTGY